MKKIVVKKENGKFVVQSPVTGMVNLVFDKQVLVKKFFMPIELNQNLNTLRLKEGFAPYISGLRFYSLDKEGKTIAVEANDRYRIYIIPIGKVPGKFILLSVYKGAKVEIEIDKQSGELKKVIVIFERVPVFYTSVIALLWNFEDVDFVRNVIKIVHKR